MLRPGGTQHILETRTKVGVDISYFIASFHWLVLLRWKVEQKPLPPRVPQKEKKPKSITESWTW